MRRIFFVLMAAALTVAMMAASALPAFAQNFRFNDDDFVGFRSGSDNEAESGPIVMSFEVTNTGDYANQCVPALQFGNSGNFNNAPSFGQFYSLSDDFESGGIEFTIAPEQAVDCSNTVQQSSAASSDPWYGW